MLVYYDIYNNQGAWVGVASYEWQAEIIASENDGYYIEREEDIKL